MTLKLNSGIMPVVDVGMYRSILDPDFIFESEENEVYNSENLTEDEKDYFSTAANHHFNTSAYKALVAKQGGYKLEEFFKSIQDVVKVKLVGTPTIWSPEFYNFRSDELDFEIEITQDEIDKILPAVKDDDLFWKFIEEAWCSRSGFASSMPYTKVKFEKAISGGDIERALAMYLTYLDAKNNDFIRPEFGYDYEIYDYISSNSGLLEFIDDEKACEIAYRA